MNVFRKISPRVALALCMLGACQAAATAAEAPGCTDGGRTRSVVDMAGRTVVLPKAVKRIATVGSVPVINGYLFALGAGERIANGLPSRFAQSNRWRLQSAIAPHLAERPVLQRQAGSEVSMETLVRLSPDVVLTMDPHGARTLKTARFPVVVLEWRNADDIHKNMALLGCMLDRLPRSAEYLRYFDATMARIGVVLDGVPQPSRPKVLYFNPHTMSTPLAIANWWIEGAGGRSVTAGMSRDGSARFSHEQMLLWNPDVLIVGSPEQAAAVRQDARFSKISAVRNGRVHVAPIGAHSWGQRTVEQPLTALWAAALFHPERFAGLDMAGEVRTFYRRFFAYDPSSEEVRSILTGDAE
jgi:iron complex transport system substrate-binding protein